MAHRLLSVGWSLSEPSKCMACGLSYHSMLLPNFGVMVNKWLNCRLWKKSLMFDSWRAFGRFISQLLLRIKALWMHCFCFESLLSICLWLSLLLRLILLRKTLKDAFLCTTKYTSKVNAMGGIHSHKRMPRAMYFDPWRENWRFWVQLYKQNICTLRLFV